MPRGFLLAVSFVVALAAFACTDIPPEPLQLEHGMLTVNNQSANDWNNVEIWINRYFRVTVPKIAARSRFQVPLNAFVSGYAQRFDIKHILIKDLRLTAKQADGTLVDLKMDDRSTLSAALGGKK